MTKIISKPNPKKPEREVSGLNQQFGFGYYETIGRRPEQEDALAWHVLDQKDLIPEGRSEQLTPEEIGHRLWTSYRVLDTIDLDTGTTAVTTVYDGKGHFITATLADAASFAVVYDKEGKALGVTRLNSVTHKPSDESECDRIKATEGGYVWFDRVDGRLAVSRAIGDNIYELKKHGVCSEATIDITNADKIAKDLGIKPSEVGFIQIINTCDGFTDGADDQSKKDHEEYLLCILKELQSPGTLPQDALAKRLSDCAQENGSRDNISIAIQTITTGQTPPVLMGVYDGHFGIGASTKVADNIGRVFKEQCTLAPVEYAEQKLSVQSNQAIYERDNKWDASLGQTHENNIQEPIDTTPEVVTMPSEKMPAESEVIAELLLTTTNESILQKPIDTARNDLYEATKNYQKNLNSDSNEYKAIAPVINHLMGILENEQWTNEEKVKQYYSFLDQTHHQVKGKPAVKNIDIIKKDTRRSALDFLTGIAIIAATVATGVLPGLLIIGIVYAATGKTPLDLFKSYGNKFEEKLHHIKENSSLASGFFKPATTPSDKPDGSPEPSDSPGNQPV